MTGADWNRGNRAPKAVPLGYMADKAVAEQKLKGLMNRTGINVLDGGQREARDGNLPPVLRLPAELYCGRDYR
ncbi:Uncharacterised protein [Cedecea neteri]|uniref:Uncharacterized protein n=1 Tax=Cedecea neteri TaxID=158822 RepID=A0A2X3J8W7_9ENTR|nr:Uncharacterised protein [Cedecea neteri]